MPPTSGSRFTNQATGRNRVDRKFLGTRKCGFQIGAEERNGRNWVALECSLLFKSGVIFDAAGQQFRVHLAGTKHRMAFIQFAQNGQTMV